jgi:hypothetical protein
MLNHRPGLYDLTQRLAMRVENNDLWRTKPRLEAGYRYGVQYSWPLHLVNVTGFEFWTASIHPFVSVRATGRIVRYSLVNTVPINPGQKLHSCASKHMELGISTTDT